MKSPSPPPSCLNLSSPNSSLPDASGNQGYHTDRPSQPPQNPGSVPSLETVNIGTCDCTNSTRPHRGTRLRPARVSPYHSARLQTRKRVVHQNKAQFHFAQDREPILGADLGTCIASNSKKPDSTLDEAVSFWERYNTMSGFEDKEFVKASGASLDTLLIFAGLFSAVNAAFIIEAIRPLQPDRTERTNALIQSVFLTMNQSSSVTLDPPLEPPHSNARSLRSNAVFFASLCSSLAASFGAVLGKQWLRHYEHEGNVKPSATRGRVRQRKYEGRNRWHLEGVIETLPVILQLSVFLFLFALTDFLWPLSRPSAWVTISFIVVTFLLYSSTTIIAVNDSNSPFQTTTSVFLRSSRPFRALGRFWIRMKSCASRTKRRVQYVFRNSSMRDWPRYLYQTIIGLHSHASTKLGRIHYSFSPMSLVTSQPRAVMDDSFKIADIERTSLGCVAWALKRVSSPRDIEGVLNALGALPLEPRVGRSDPVVVALVESLFNFLIKPNMERSGVANWRNESIDLQRFLKILHTIFIHWDYLRDHPVPGISPEWPEATVAEYSTHLFQYLQASLWGVFCRKPGHVGSVKLIAGVMPRLQEYQRCSEMELDTLLGSFNPTRQNASDILPYLTLLSGEIYRVSRTSKETEEVMVSKGVGDALIATMWVDNQVDLDLWRGRLRVDWLPRLVSGNVLAEKQFSNYLLEWSKKHICSENTPNPVDDTITSLRSYLKAIYRLLKMQSYPAEKLWLQVPESGDHTSCLAQILQGKIAVPLPQLFDLHSKYEGRSNALYCLIILWHRRWTGTPESERSSCMHGQPSLVVVVVDCLTPDCSKYLVQSFDLFPRKSHPTRLSLMMEYLALFLEEASRLQLLTRGMEHVVEGYKLWGQWFLGADESRSLYERIEKLTFY